MQSWGKLRKLGRLIGNPGLWPERRRLVLRDRRGEEGPDRGLPAHLAATAGWLARAHDATGDGGGVSAAFHLRFGWLPPYPETTGYIIPSFFDYAAFSGDESFRRRAFALADWECRIQMEDGSVRAGIGLQKDAAVFDTGQGLFGFLRAWEESSEEIYLEAAERAGLWLRQCQDEDGCWRRNTYRRVPHSYNTRTAWALLRLWRASGEEAFRKAARHNLQWAASRQE